MWVSRSLLWGLWMRNARKMRPRIRYFGLNLISLWTQQERTEIPGNGYWQGCKVPAGQCDGSSPGEVPNIPLVSACALLFISEHRTYIPSTWIQRGLVTALTHRMWWKWHLGTSSPGLKRLPLSSCWKACSWNPHSWNPIAILWEDQTAWRGHMEESQNALVDVPEELTANSQHSHEWAILSIPAWAPDGRSPSCYHMEQKNYPLEPSNLQTHERCCRIASTPKGTFF